MKKSLLFFYFLFFSLVFTACKKDSSSPSSPTPPTQGNIAGVYRITGLKVQTGNNDQADVYEELTECQKNDTWGFQENGTFLFGGAQAADCGDPDLSGTWAFNEHTFTITTNDGSDEYQFVSFDGRLLKLSIEGTYNDASATYYIIFTKQ